VPSATGHWGDCDPSEPRNRRRRPAVFVETADRHGEPRQLLIDAPPELRDQLAPLLVRELHGVLLTHGHADHLHGLDDLRPIARLQRRLVPVWGDRHVLDEVRHRFAYAVAGTAEGAYRPIVDLAELKGSCAVAGVDVVAFDLDHGFGNSTGFRIGQFGYTIDVVRMSEQAFEILSGIDVWIVDCQQFEPHPTHSHLEQTLSWVARVRPRRAILTHLGPRLDYRTLTGLLPDGVEVGYDGLTISVDGGR
jgi:phosphoribosyl 1,2-cyclic phosphate phosphodiesterase